MHAQPARPNRILFGGLLPCLRTWSNPCTASCTKLHGHTQQGQAAPCQTPPAIMGLKHHCFGTDPCIHPQPQRPWCNGHTCLLDQTHHHHSYGEFPVTTPALPLTAFICAPLQLCGAGRQAGTADMWGWGSSEEWAESRLRYTFSDYKISVFLFKVLSVNILYYRSSTTVSTDCQY